MIAVEWKYSNRADTLLRSMVLSWKRLTTRTKPGLALRDLCTRISISKLKQLKTGRKNSQISWVSRNKL